MTPSRRAPGDPFLLDAAQLARRLLGARLVHEVDGVRLVGRIVETEAYLAEGDRASHSRSGPSRRNRSMFLAGGAAYVYRIYGLHHCFNVVAGPEGRGEAVLVRAVEPLEGLERMAALRKAATVRDLCRGPARLVEAFAIGAHHDGIDLRTGALRVEPDAPLPRRAIARGPRIGIGESCGEARSLELRFGIAASPWLSRPFSTSPA